MNKFWKYATTVVIATVVLMLLSIKDKPAEELKVSLEPIPVSGMINHDIDRVFLDWQKASVEVPVTEETVVEDTEDAIKSAPYSFIKLDDELQIYLEERCAVYELDFFLMASLMFSESSFRTKAVGDNGNSVGLFQINKVWWKKMANKGLDVNDPKNNIEIGLIIFEDLMDKTGWDAEMAIQFYKCGEARGKKLWKQGTKLSSIKGIIERADEWREK